MIKRKLQVFISSTYLDLKEERQAAVEAILGAGHIPAGMELFKAGNNSQLTTIKKWINQSDIYMLILGGRYGTIEENSQKSYTQLEYEYAITKNIPIFAVVLSDVFLKQKALEESYIYEEQYQKKYDDFKENVKKKMIKEVNEIKDIQIGIYESLKELQEENQFSGWIPGNLINDNLFVRIENINDIDKEIKLLKERKMKLKIDKACEVMSQKVIVHCVMRNKDCGIKTIEITSLLEIFLDISTYLQNKNLSAFRLKRILKNIVILRDVTVKHSELKIVQSDLDKIIYQLSILELIWSDREHFYLRYGISRFGYNVIKYIYGDEIVL